MLFLTILKLNQWVTRQITVKYSRKLSGVLTCKLKKNMLVFSMKKINDKIVSGLQVMEFFFINEWHWSVKKSDALREVLCSEDQAVKKLHNRISGFYSLIFVEKSNLRKSIRLISYDVAL